RSDPGSGAVVLMPPEDDSRRQPLKLRIWFTERAEERFTFIEVRDPSQERVDVEGSLSLESQGIVAAVDVEPGKMGSYTVDFRVLSAVDGHINTGGFSFVVAEASPGQGSLLDELPQRLVVRTPQSVGARSISVELSRDGETVSSGEGSFSA